MISRIIYLIAILSLVAFACKSTQNYSPQHEQLILLLEEGIQPNELPAFEKSNVIDQKRTSKSQNQWIITLKLDATEMAELRTMLSKDIKVLEVQTVESSSNQNTTNSKKSTSTPKINN